jgi:hypothetical protein
MNSIDNYLSVKLNNFNFSKHLHPVKISKTLPIVIKLSNVKINYRANNIEYVHYNDPIHSQK